MKLNKPFILWFTGLPCSGKTTLAGNLEHVLDFNHGVRLAVFDGDILRKSLSKDLGFSPADRNTHNLRVAEKANELTGSGIPVCVALISPYSKTRELIRNKYSHMVEVYIKCPIEICESRDTKGLYKKARKGEVKNFTGIDAPYEEPLNPGIIVETDKMTVEECAHVIKDSLETMDYIQSL
ncbi:hypothetical protein UR09_05250 [Candidatus Nitromaritima sp. SCGC AAA799-A02]|nr:hypothetical protein UR09_05250 [Candidatus Nitromaritima sp. SCGC AAA799-A02]